MTINNYPCWDCKYFNTCGDYLRREDCAGREEAEAPEAIKSREKIKAIITEINTAADDCKTEINALKDDRKTMHDLIRAHKEKDEAALKRIDEAAEKLAAYSETLYRLNILRKCWQHNYRIALFNEAIPAICEALTKYAGKPCGEKTRQKIYAEVKKTGVYFFFDRDYSGRAYWCISDDFLNLYNSNGDITAWDRENHRQVDLLPDNKILIPDVSTLSYYYHDYIYNPAQRVNDLIAAHKAAQEAQEATQAACSDFNALVPYNMETLYYSKNIYHTIDGC